MGRPKTTVLLALRVADPIEWRRRVRDALIACGEVPNAAKQLGIARDTLFRWLSQDPSLRDGIKLPKPGPR